MTRQEAIDLANQMAAFASIWIDDDGDEVNDLVKFAKAAYAAGAAAERDECAKVCDEQQELVGAEMCCVAMNCASAIRARGEA